MIPHLASAYCWVILISAVVTALVAVWGLVSPHYRDTLLENVALCVVVVACTVVVLQIHVTGSAQRSGMAFMAASFAFYALAKALKGLADHHDRQHHQPSEGRP